jgi:hypothetical protein
MAVAFDKLSNHLLAALPDSEWQRWQQHMSVMDLNLGQVLYESGGTKQHVYFPVNAIVSLLYVLENGSSAEIAVDDLFYRPGVLLASVSAVHAVTAGSAITMTGLAMVGLFFKPRGRVMRTVSWISLGMVAIYLLNTYVLFLYGE